MAAVRLLGCAYFTFHFLCLDLYAEPLSFLVQPSREALIYHGSEGVLGGHLSKRKLSFRPNEPSRAFVAQVNCGSARTTVGWWKQRSSLAMAVRWSSGCLSD